MTSTLSRRASAVSEVAEAVFCLGPWGRTMTNAYLVRGEGGSVLVDTGWVSDASPVKQAVRMICGTVRPSAILLTHAHPDHSGAALTLAREWRCEVHMHPAELPIARGDFATMLQSAGPLDRWVILPLMRAIGTRRRERILTAGSLGELARPLSPDRGVPFLPEWRWLPTPGHTPGHVAYFRPRDRLLLSGDALVTLQLNTVTGLLRRQACLAGPPWYTTWNSAAARESVRRLAALEPNALASGHGAALTDADTPEQVAAFAAQLPS